MHVDVIAIIFTLFKPVSRTTLTQNENFTLYSKVYILRIN